MSESPPSSAHSIKTHHNHHGDRTDRKQGRGRGDFAKSKDAVKGTWQAVHPVVKQRTVQQFLLQKYRIRTMILRKNPDVQLFPRERFLQELDRFWQIILHSSEHTAYEEIDWENYAPGWEEKTPDDPLKDQPSLRIMVNMAFSRPLSMETVI